MRSPEKGIPLSSSLGCTKICMLIGHHKQRRAEGAVVFYHALTPQMAHRTLQVNALRAQHPAYQCDERHLALLDADELSPCWFNKKVCVQFRCPHSLSRQSTKLPCVAVCRRTGPSSFRKFNDEGGYPGAPLKPYPGPPYMTGSAEAGEVEMHAPAGGLIRTHVCCSSNA